MTVATERRSGDVEWVVLMEFTAYLQGGESHSASRSPT
jgi:hypothetical protein